MRHILTLRAGPCPAAVAAGLLGLGDLGGFSLTRWACKDSSQWRKQCEHSCSGSAQRHGGMDVEPD
jgi:hypothetical protein